MKKWLSDIHTHIFVVLRMFLLSSQANPLLDILESLFDVPTTTTIKEEEGESGDKGEGEEGDGEIGEDEEEGMICDSNTEVLPLTSPLIKVTRLLSVVTATKRANQCTCA